jgi:hypothetical protein
LHSLPSRSSPIRTTRSSFIRPRETGIVWEGVTAYLCHTLTGGGFRGKCPVLSRVVDHTVYIVS